MHPNRVSLVAAALLTVTFAGGCRKKSPTPSPKSEEPAQASTSQSAGLNSTGNPFMDQAVASGNPQAVIQAFNQIIEARFMTATSPLTNLDQLVTEGSMKRLPDGPGGRKYFFDAKTRQVVLR